MKKCKLTIHRSQSVKTATPQFLTIVTFRVSSTFGPTPAYSGEALERIVSIMEKEIPLDGQFSPADVDRVTLILDGAMVQRRQRRDRLLAGMAKLWKDIDN